MDEKLKDILSNSNKDIDNQKLMDYLSGKLSKEESHEIEKSMADSEFMNDAVEGLQDFKEKKDIGFFVEQLNRNLQKNLAKKKDRKEKRRLKDQPWLILAIIILLLLTVVSYIVIKKHLDESPPTEQVN